MIWTRDEFVGALEKLKWVFVGDKGEYAVGYMDAIDDVLSIIEDEGGCFREDFWRGC
jgi:hypothetical protein